MKKMLTKILTGFLLLARVAAGGGPAVEETWTLERCLQFGLDQHPQLKIARSSVESEKARLLQTGAAFDPRIDFRASWSHSKLEAARGRSIADATTDSTSEAISASKLLYDSGQTRLQKKAAAASLSAANSRFDATLTELAADIKASFFRAQQANALLQVRQETLEGYERHLEKVESFVEVGTRAPCDINLGPGDIEVALANLSRAIGLDTAIVVASYDETKPPLNIYDDKERLLHETMNRPDVRASQEQVRAADYRVSEAKLNRSPSLSASADYRWSGTATPLDRQWGMGVSMSWPVLDGAVTRAQIQSARSSFESSVAGLENIKLSVGAELENSLTRLTDALERLQATTVLVQQASESMHLAEGRYDAGLGSPLEITDARVEFARARGNHVVAFFDSLIAQAELDRVLGRLPAECRIQEMDAADRESGETDK